MKKFILLCADCESEGDKHAVFFDSVVPVDDIADPTPFFDGKDGRKLAIRICCSHCGNWERIIV